MFFVFLLIEVVIAATGEFRIETTVNETTTQNPPGGGGGSSTDGECVTGYTKTLINGTRTCIPIINISTPPTNASQEENTTSWPLKLFNVSWIDKKTLKINKETTLHFILTPNQPSKIQDTLLYISKNCDLNRTLQAYSWPLTRNNELYYNIKTPKTKPGTYCLSLIIITDQSTEITNFEAQLTEMTWYEKAWQWIIKNSKETLTITKQAYALTKNKTLSLVKN
jgi:hypothetical protein